MKKKIMILGAGLYQVPLIETAKRMGYETIVVSIPGPYQGFDIADKSIYIDTRDRHAILEAALREKISGIVTTGTDVAVRSIGYVCERMGLHGISYEASSILCNKAKMKEAFLAGNVRCAEGRKAESLAKAIEIAEEIGYPVVVKRVDSSGSRGVTIVDHPDQMKAAYLLAREKTMHDYVLVERCLRGVEIGVDGFVRGKKVVFLAPHTKFVYRGRTSTVPVGHAFPYPCSDALLEDIKTQMQRAAAASGADNCCFNADVFVDGDEASLIEMGGRCGATCIPELISCHYGFDYYEAMITEAMGDAAAFPEHGKTACMAKLLFSPVEGILTEVDEAGLQELRREGVDVQIDHPVGGHVFAMADGTDRFGSVLMKTEDESCLEDALDRVRSCLSINGRRLQELWNG